MTRLLLGLLALVIFLSGCLYQPETGPDADGMVNTNKTVLWVPGKEWTALVNLTGFSDFNSGGTFPSRFLAQERDDGMIITIFAENISAVMDTDSCREYYANTTRRYLENRLYLQEFEETYPEEFESGEMNITGSSSLELRERGDMALSEYSLFMYVYGENIVQKRVHAYNYHDGYCFDFHISQTEFEEGDMQKFYDIIDSIEFVPLNDIHELENAYSILEI